MSRRIINDPPRGTSRGDPLDWFFVEHSCLPGAVGLGLFTRYDLERGTLFPGCYSGVYITSDEYINLVLELEKLAKHQTSGWRTSRRIQTIEDKATIYQLEKHYGIHILPNNKDDSRQTPDWAAICKCVTDYAFESEDTGEGQTMVTVLPDYGYNGKLGKGVLEDRPLGP